MNAKKRKAAGARMDAIFHAEILAMKAKGASAADLSEPVFQDMVRQQVYDRHAKELEDPEIWEFLVEDFLDTASPESLRDLAREARDAGRFDTAYDLEELADLRERECP
jgi:hypothetical protein